MKFWDTSALAALCCHEPGSHAARSHWVGSGHCAWKWSWIELYSAFCRKRNEGGLTDQEVVIAAQKREDLFAALNVFVDVDLVFAEAESVLRHHILKAADATQLAAANLLAGKSRDRTFLCFDRKLCAAAAREGFSVPLAPK